MNHLHREIALLVGISPCLGAHVGKYKFLTEERSSSKFSYWLDKACPNTAQHTNMHLFCQYSGSRKHKPTKNHTTILANLSEYLCLTSQHNFSARVAPVSGSALAPSWPASFFAQLSAWPWRNTHLCEFMKMAERMVIWKHSKMKHMGMLSSRISMF